MTSVENLAMGQSLTQILNIGNHIAPEMMSSTQMIQVPLVRPETIIQQNSMSTTQMMSPYMVMSPQMPMVPVSSTQILPSGQIIGQIQTAEEVRAMLNPNCMTQNAYIMQRIESMKKGAIRK